MELSRHLSPRQIGGALVTTVVILKNLPSLLAFSYLELDGTNERPAPTKNFVRLNIVRIIKTNLRTSIRNTAAGNSPPSVELECGPASL